MDNIPDVTTLMDQLMHLLKDNIYFMDRQGHIVMISDEGARWLGFNEPEEVIGKTDLDIFTEEHGREAYEDEQRIMRTGQPILAKEEKETWADGHETWVSTSKLPLRDKDGNIIGTFGLSRDITDHKKAELRAKRFAEENRRLCDQLESDLQMAAELQKAFLPQRFVCFPQDVAPAESAARFFHRYQAVSSVGGDFCSVRRLSDTEAAILLCDVMGHGVRASLITALIRAIVEEISAKFKDPGSFLHHMNSVLKPIIQQDDQCLCVSACYMVLDLSTGNLSYSMAGHPAPILLDAETKCAQWLNDNPRDTGPALAVESESSYSTLNRKLHPGDAVMMYTDGLCGVTDINGRAFGTDRLLELLNALPDQSLGQLFDTLIERISKYASDGKLDDDVCLIGCRFVRHLES